MAILILFSLQIRKAKKKKKKKRRRKKIFLCQTKGGGFCFFYLGSRNKEKKKNLKLVYVLLKQLVNKLWLTISMWNFPRLLYL